MAVAEPTRRLEPVDAGEVHVHQHEVRERDGRDLEGLLPGDGPADDLEARGLLHDRVHRAQVRLLVVDQQDPYHRHVGVTSSTESRRR